MHKSPKLIGVGSPVVDTIARVEDAFIDSIDGEKGGMVLVDASAIDALSAKISAELTRSPGGSAGNTLFALARLGAATAFMGKIGNCANGQFYRDRFAQIGGDPSRFKLGQTMNGQCLSLVTPDGERTMRTHLGAAMTLQPEEINTTDFEGCYHAHIEGYLLFNHELLQAVLKAAKNAGCSISLDLASFEVVNAAREILPDILRDYVDIVFANEDEAAAYTGKTGDYAAMARELAELCQIAAVKMGADGAWLATPESLHKVEAVPAENVIDTTGAGDLWAAGFLYGWSEKRSLPESAFIGSLLGSAVVQQQGSELTDAAWARLIRQIDTIAIPS